MDNAARYVRPGGVLVYSTCSLNRAENEDVVRGFLEKHPEMEPDPMPAGLPAAGGKAQATLMPMDGFDGFFIARMRRRGP